MNIKPTLSFRLIISLTSLTVLVSACTSSYKARPQRFGGQNAAAPEENTSVKNMDNGNETGEKYPSSGDRGATNGSGQTSTPNGTREDLPKSIAITQTQGAKLGLKAPEGCSEANSAKSSGLGVYVNFEVVEDNTQITFSLERLCGGLAQKNAVSLLDSSGKLQLSQLLGAKEIKAKTQLLSSGTLAKGRYTLAIEAAGSTLETLSSFFMGGAVLEGTKGIKLESISEF